MTFVCPFHGQHRLFIANLGAAIGISSVRGCLPYKTKYYKWKGVIIHLSIVGKMCWRVLRHGHVIFYEAILQPEEWNFFFFPLDYNIFESNPFLETEVWDDVQGWGQEWCMKGIWNGEKFGDMRNGVSLSKEGRNGINSGMVQNKECLCTYW